MLAAPTALVLPEMTRLPKTVNAPPPATCTPPPQSAQPPVRTPVAALLVSTRLPPERISMTRMPVPAASSVWPARSRTTAPDTVNGLSPDMATTSSASVTVPPLSNSTCKASQGEEVGLTHTSPSFSAVTKAESSLRK